MCVCTGCTLYPGQVSGNGADCEAGIAQRYDCRRYLLLAVQVPKIGKSTRCRQLNSRFLRLYLQAAPTPLMQITWHAIGAAMEQILPLCVFHCRVSTTTKPPNTVLRHHCLPGDLSDTTVYLNSALLLEAENPVAGTCSAGLLPSSPTSPPCNRKHRPPARPRPASPARARRMSASLRR